MDSHECSSGRHAASDAVRHINVGKSRWRVAVPFPTRDRVCCGHTTEDCTTRHYKGSQARVTEVLARECSGKAVSPTAIPADAAGRGAFRTTPLRCGIDLERSQGAVQGYDASWDQHRCGIPIDTAGEREERTNELTNKKRSSRRSCCFYRSRASIQAKGDRAIPTRLRPVHDRRTALQARRQRGDYTTVAGAGCLAQG